MNQEMKLLKVLTVTFVLGIGFSACENHMDINDIEAGTPSNADTVLAPSKTQPLNPEELKSYNEKLPVVYQR